MSTILKALRRLEEEKAAAEQGRPLREQIAGAPHHTHDEPPRRAWLAALLALVLGVGTGGGLIWWAFGDDASRSEVAVAAPTPAAAPERADAPAEAPTATPLPPAGPPGDAFSSDVQIVNRPDRRPRLADAEPVAPIAAAKPGQRRPVESSAAAMRARALAEAGRAAEAAALAPAPAVEEIPRDEREAAAVVAGPPSEPAASEPPPRAGDPAMPAAEPAVAPVPPPAPERVAIAEPAARPAPAPEPAAEPRPPPPPPSAVASAERSAPPAPPEPAVAVEKTRWHPLPERRIAWLRVEGEREARQVVEGDVVDGMLVAEIQPSGVVLERDGERVQRKLGSRQP